MLLPDFQRYKRAVALAVPEKNHVNRILSSALTFADLPGFIMKEKPISNEARIAIKRTALIVFFKILFIIIL